MSKFFGLFGCDNEMDDESEMEEGEYRDEDDDDEDERVAVDNQITCKELAMMESKEEDSQIIENDARTSLLATNNLCCICNTEDVKYRCPRCSFRTCSLDCCKKHKVVFNCNGVRDACPYLKVSEFTDKNLVDDYFFLERANSAIESAARKRRSICKSGMAQMGELPNWMKKLRYEARMRGTRIKFLPAGFERRLRNHTAFMYREKVIEWTVEWVFALSPDDAFKVIEKRVCENVLLIDLLASLIRRNKVIASKLGDIDLHRLHLYLRHESSELFTLVNINDSFCKVLQGKSILEFPTLVISLAEHSHCFPLLKDRVACQPVHQESDGEPSDSKKPKVGSRDAPKSENNGASTIK